MFMLRFLTALCLIPIALLGLYYLPLPILNGIYILFGFLAGVEWLKLIPLQHKKMQFGFILLLMGALLVIPFYFSFFLICSLIVWLAITIAILTFPASMALWGKKSIVAGCGLILIPTFVQSLKHLTVQRWPLITLLVLIWTADSGAYIAGKCWGRYPLIKQVSPGKTIEGLIGGLLLTLILGAILCYFIQSIPILNWLILVFSLYVISVIGDLSISMLKRRVFLKDTGNIFPGHGGFLDRFDSLIAASPFFYTAFIILKAFA